MSNMSSLSVSEDANAPTDLQVRFDCLTVEEFIEKHSNDLSRGGIFVRTPQPLAVGKAVHLDLQLRDGSAFIAGEGTIFWSREPDPTRAESEPGMGVRFGRLTAQSQQMLSYLLTEKFERERAEINVEEDVDNERTVVAPQLDLVSRSWSEKIIAQAAVAESLAAAESQAVAEPQAAPEPRAASESPAASTEVTASQPMMTPTSVADSDLASVTGEIASPPRARRRVSRGMAVGGLVFLGAMAALLPILSSRSSTKMAMASSPAAVTAGSPGATAAPRAAGSTYSWSAHSGAGIPTGGSAPAPGMAETSNNTISEQDFCVADLGNRPR
jgi:uncharacterized protein (TIGR02266 family)